MADILKREDGEKFIDYFVRLFEHKDSYDVTCQQITDLLNSEDGIEKEFKESKWRREWKSFSKGREYERNQIEKNVATRILAISDLHIPFQKPVDTFSKYFGRVDCLVLNGDIFDAQCLSKFPKPYRCSLVDDMVTARMYLRNLIHNISPKKVVITYGNHDIRLQNYLADMVDPSVAELIPRTPIDYVVKDGFRRYSRTDMTSTWFAPLTEVFPEIEIVYENNWYCQIGGTIFCHPLAYSGVAMKTAMKAVDWFRNEGFVFTCLVMAHTHRLGEYTIGNTIAYEQGACCETSKMQYTNGKLVPSQKEGYLYLCQDDEGNNVREHSKLVSLN